MEKKTPLYDSHVALGAKMVEFGGFLMPVQYPSGILAEHMAVREKAGLFDVSHMGELVFHGEDAKRTLLQTSSTSSPPTSPKCRTATCATACSATTKAAWSMI